MLEEINANPSGDQSNLPENPIDHMTKGHIDAPNGRNNIVESHPIVSPCLVYFDGSIVCQNTILILWYFQLSM